MLMASAGYMRMDSTYSSSSASSTISPPPWHPVVPVSVPTHHQHQAVLYDPDLTTPSPSPSPSPSPPPRNHHLRPGGATRRASSRRRPRPSRKVPTTYISADPTSFRRMVHQVTGADDQLLLPPLAPRHEATTLCRPAPTRAAAAGALPTLGTSALLLDSGSGSGSARRTTGPAASGVDLGAGGGGVGVGLGGGGYGGCGGFPTLESWDALL